MYTKRIFISIPEGEIFRKLYEESIKPLTNGPFEVVCYYDHPNLDEFSHSISALIGYSNLVICVLSGNNPNVLYEVGLAIGYGKPIIPVTDSVDNLPAMLRGRVALTYDRYKPDSGRLFTDLKVRFDYVLHGEYMPLRVRTHAELSPLRGDPKKESPEISNDPLATAIRMYAGGQYLEAIKVLETLTVSHPTEQVYFYLADCHFLYAESLPESLVQTSHYEEFLAVSETAHKLFPAHRDLHKNIGLANLKLRRLRQAKSSLSRLLKEHPTFGVGRYNMACVHAQLGEVFDCLRELSLVVDQEPLFRSLARVDPDFAPVWLNDLFQRLIFPMPRAR